MGHSPGHSPRVPREQRGCRAAAATDQSLPAPAALQAGPALTQTPSQELWFVANNCCGGSFCIKQLHKTFRDRTAKPNLHFSPAVRARPMHDNLCLFSEPS